MARASGARPPLRAARLLAASAALAAALAVGVGGARPAGAAPALSFTMQWSAGPLADTGNPIAESSPVPALLDGGGPAVVVGDRAGSLYAFHLADGSAVRGWPMHDGGVPIDATPSVLAGARGLDTVFVGAGNAQHPATGGYLAFGPDGTERWHTAVQDPGSDGSPAGGVQASLTVADLDGTTGVVAGSLDQQAYALDAGTGEALPGWPFFSADSIFSTAAVADLYGIGRTTIVEGGAQTAGFGIGRHYEQGGHVRIMNPEGGLVCEALTDQTVDSSPAVGPILAGGGAGVVTGTGAFFAGASDTDTVKAYDTHCRPVWSARLDGVTTSSPAIASVTGTGLQVVEGTDTGTSGSVWVLDGASGAVLWHEPVVGRVIGSVVTADLTGGGYQDVIVPTTAGAEVFDGRSGTEVTVLAPHLGLQNAPLVTADPGGGIGITVAGYIGSNQGMVEHFVVSGGGSGAGAVGAGSWPMFHHDPQLTGAVGMPPTPAPNACQVPTGARAGYLLVAADGGVFGYGQAYCGSMGSTTLAAPVVGATAASGQGGYWMVGADGGVFAFGEAQFYGSMGGIPLAAPVVAMAATPDGKGYWLVGADGGVFAFGDAPYFGSMGGTKLAAPVVAMAPSLDGLGYRLVGADGGVFAFGDAQYFGSMGGTKLAAPVVAMANDAATAGYWLVGADGGVIALAAPVVAATATLDGDGYRMVGADGGVFVFGDATYRGSAAGLALRAPVVSLLSS
jgi:hypothetical protein